MRVHEEGQPDRFEPRSDKEKLRVDAAAARAAVTKAFGGLLPAFVTVKHTPIPTGSLVIGPKDSDERAYVLAIGIGCEFEIPGWAWGRERASRGEWRADVRSPGHFIPQAELRTIDTLGDG